MKIICEIWIPIKKLKKKRLLNNYHGLGDQFRRKINLGENLGDSDNLRFFW